MQNFTRYTELTHGWSILCYYVEWLPVLAGATISRTQRQWTAAALLILYSRFWQRMYMYTWLQGVSRVNCMWLIIYKVSKRVNLANPTSKHTHAHTRAQCTYASMGLAQQLLYVCRDNLSAALKVVWLCFMREHVRHCVVYVSPKYKYLLDSYNPLSKMKLSHHWIINCTMHFQW